MSQRFTKENNRSSVVASYNLANCRFAEKRYADALALYQGMAARRDMAQRIQVCESAVSSMPEADRKAKDLPPEIGDVAVWKELIASGKTSLANNRIADAKAILDAALAEATAIGPTDSRVAETKIVLGDLSFQQGNTSQAQDLYEQANLALPKDGHALAQLALCQLSSQQYTQAADTLKRLNAVADKATWIALIPTIDTLFDGRRFRGSDKQLVDLLSSICQNCVKATDSKNNMLRATALANLARTYQIERDTDKAAPLIQQAVQIAEKSPDKDEAQLFRLHRDAGMIYLTAEQFNLAEPQFKQAFALAQNNPGKDSRTLRQAIGYMKALYSKWRRPDQEEIYLKQEIALSQMNDSKSLLELSGPAQLVDLSKISREKGDFDQAAQYLEQAIKMKTDRRGSQSEMRELISMYEECGRWDKLQALHEQLAAMSGDPLGQQARQEIFAPQCAAKQGKYDSAVNGLEGMIAGMESTKENRDKFFGCYYTEPRYTSCVHLLGNCVLDGSGNYDKAITIYDKGISAEKQQVGGPECRPIRVGGGVAPAEPQEVPLTI